MRAFYREYRYHKHVPIPCRRLHSVQRAKCNDRLRVKKKKNRFCCLLLLFYRTEKRRPPKTLPCVDHAVRVTIIMILYVYSSRHADRFPCHNTIGVRSSAAARFVDTSIMTVLLGISYIYIFSASFSTRIFFRNTLE